MLGILDARKDSRAPLFPWLLASRHTPNRQKPLAECLLQLSLPISCSFSFNVQSSESTKSRRRLLRRYARYEDTLNAGIRLPNASALYMWYFGPCTSLWTFEQRLRVATISNPMRQCGASIYVSQSAVTIFSPCCLTSPGDDIEQACRYSLTKE